MVTYYLILSHQTGRTALQAASLRNLCVRRLARLSAPAWSGPRPCREASRGPGRGVPPRSLLTFNFELLTSSSSIFQPLDFSSLGLTFNLQLSTFNCLSFPSSRLTLSQRSANSFTIRTSMTPLPQLLYNPHLQAPLGSAGNKGLITPLESALTKNSPVSLLESALAERWGWGWGSCFPLRSSPLATCSSSVPAPDFTVWLLRFNFQLSTFNCQLSAGDSDPVGTVHSIHRDAAQELGIKVGGLLRQHFPGGGDLHDLLDIARIQQKRNLRLAAVHGLQRGRDFSFIRQVPGSRIPSCSRTTSSSRCRGETFGRSCARLAPSRSVST